MNDKEIREGMSKLVKSVKETIDNEKAKGTIQSEFMPVTQWKVTDFKYDDNGINAPRSGINIIKPTWRSSSIQIFQIIKIKDEYTHLSNILEQTPKVAEREILLNSFITRIILSYLDKAELSDTEISTQIDNFISELKDERVKSEATALLVGLILHPDEIEIAHGIKLRKPKKEDFEIESPIYDFHRYNPIPDPTAFLNISIQTNSTISIQDEVTKMIAILRLFKCGSVKFTEFKMHSYIISGTLGSGDISPPQEKYIIKNDDVDYLKKFYKNVSPILPLIFYRLDTGREDHLSIAYNRYSDALLQSGIIERRITNAIMGLEALYFKPSGEQQELIYRLSIRVAKVLGNFSFDPLKIRSTLKDAYVVRSIFSHGGHLDYTKKKKFNEKYDGDINNLLIKILDILRISIIISMTIRSEKDEFIDVIDHALIDPSSNQQLIGILNPAKNILKSAS